MSVCYNKQQMSPGIKFMIEFIEMTQIQASVWRPSPNTQDSRIPSQDLQETIKNTISYTLNKHLFMY